MEIETEGSYCLNENCPMAIFWIQLLKKRMKIRIEEGPCLGKNCPIIIFGMNLLPILIKDGIKLEKNEVELKQALKSIIRTNMAAKETGFELRMTCFMSDAIREATYLMEKI